MTVTTAIIIIILLCLMNIVVDWLILTVGSGKLTRKTKIILLLLTGTSTLAGLMVMILVGYIQPTINSSISDDESRIEAKGERFDGESDKNTDTAQDGEKVQRVSEQQSELAAPDLLGMDELSAIDTCVQNGYTYTLEYLFGGDGTVVRQRPSVGSGIEPGDNIVMRIGVQEDIFSEMLLGVINETRKSAGLGELSFSDQLNSACATLARENVLVYDSTRPDGSRWSSVLSENNIALKDGMFVSISIIASVEDVDKRMPYEDDGSSAYLLNPSYDIIGMAYTEDRQLIIIAGY